jgi:hypothetical protein
MAGVVREIGWSVMAYVCCMALDMVMLNRAAFAYIAPKGAPTIEPKFWNGYKARHVVLLPVAFLVQYLVRREMADASPFWIVLGALILIYAILLVWNLLEQRHPAA